MLDPDEVDFDTGWFGVPGDYSGKKSTKVHVVHSDSKKPICGAVISGGHIFQWNSRGIYLPVVECKKCRKSLENRFPDELVKRFD